MDLSGHSVCNDKQEENIWMFVYTIVYLQGKMKVLFGNSLFLQPNHGKTSEMDRLVVQK